jgi:TusA-related sulfurtransferase
VRTKLALEELAPGSELEIWLDHRSAFRNVPRALREDGHQVLSCEISDEPLLCRIVVRSHIPPN